MIASETRRCSFFELPADGTTDISATLTAQKVFLGFYSVRTGVRSQTEGLNNSMPHIWLSEGSLQTVDRQNYVYVNRGNGVYHVEDYGLIALITCCCRYTDHLRSPLCLAVVMWAFSPPPPHQPMNRLRKMVLWRMLPQEGTSELCNMTSSQR